jgi:uncharacterized membrane protein
MESIYLILFYFLTPFIILYVCHHSKTLQKIGAIVIAYLLGFIFGNIGLLPKASQAFRQLTAGKGYLSGNEAQVLFEKGTILQSDLLCNQIASTQDLILTIAIPLAIPMLLFSLDIKNSFRTMKHAVFSTFIAILSLLIALFIGHFLFSDSIFESWKVSGMMAGLYTGGTPNLVALGTALNVDPTIFVLTNTYDLIVGVVLLFFFITVAQRFMNLFLPHFNGKGAHKKTKDIIKESEGNDNYINLLDWKITRPLLGALGISTLIFAIGGGLSLLVPKDHQMAVVILTITTLAILVSLIPAVNNIKKTFEFGMYLILVFSMVISSMADFSNIFQIEYLNLFLYVVIAVIGAMLIHVVLSWIFKIDTDTTIITITALSMSPPFVPVVAGALKNKEIIVMGITVGVFGYAIGNYLGIFIAYFLKGL